MQSASPQELPLLPILAETIRRSGVPGVRLSGERCRGIPFRDYMELCLYEPAFGYYSGGSVRIGREGDFYTSAYIGEAMGETLAHALARLAEERFGAATAVEVIDWGGGTGRLGRHMLDAWEAAGEAGQRFRLTVLERSPRHRERAAETLADAIRAGKARVRSAEALDPAWAERPVIVVANELLDAFPVRRVTWRDGRWREWGVAWDEAAGRPAPCLLESFDPGLAAELAEAGVRLLEGQTAEWCDGVAPWLAGLTRGLGAALLVLIDYGDETRELTAPHRMDGTLVCYRRHIAHGDPYAFPGEQDMTAHVNFSAVRQAAVRLGWEELWYGTQKRFLVEAGILQRLVAHDASDPFHPAVRRNRAIRQLLLSDGMSELFKVQIFAKRT
jgi:SAM-dependent MidA family methyltransferase